MNQQEQHWQIWIDTGGTFTDCLGIDPEGVWHRQKVLSHGALRSKIIEILSLRRIKIQQNWGAPEQFIKGFEFALLEMEGVESTVHSFSSGEAIIELEDPICETWFTEQTFEVRSSLEAPTLAAHLITGTPCDQYLPEMQMRLATTRGTNALLEQKGARTALFVTKGYKDLLKIGNQQRPDLFALDVQRPAPLYHDVIEVPERMDAEGNVLEGLGFDAIDSAVDDLLERDIKTAAIGLLHSYQNSAHEEKLANWLRKKGFKYVSRSSNLANLIKILPRTETTLVDAYLTPVIQDYLQHVQNHLYQGNLHIMTSAGGLVGVSDYNSKDSLLSGPAGGVVGASAVGKQCGFEKVISFDMGGTSTDVSRFAGDFDYVFEHTVGDAQLFAPALAIETVAAGGGSICTFDGRALNVGPESAGADPGPACYGAGGPFTLTDVNLLLGRLDPANFGIPVDYETAKSKFEAIYSEISSQNDSDAPPSRHSILQGFLDIANERMADTIRKISVRKGYDIQEYTLVGFGGAGGQHVCAIARRLGVEKIIVPPDAGLLSAYGLGRAVIEKFAEKQLLEPLGDIEPKIDHYFEDLAKKAARKLHQEGISDKDIVIRRQLVFMRLAGQESALEIEYTGQNLKNAFKDKYEARYGHWLENRTIEIESIRVVASQRPQFHEDITANKKVAPYQPSEAFSKSINFSNKVVHTPVYYREKLNPGAYIEGPALVLDPYSTLVVEPGWNAESLQNGHLFVTRSSDKTGSWATSAEEKPESALIELFTNRFSTIAEEMGEMLQRTALSVNVKERLDFSCALLDKQGRLVVNAPHIPVHLGALGLCIREVSEEIDWKPGDVVVTNHPAYGGSHLPDITVITPVFDNDSNFAGFAASRAHHAEVGGSRPGSMPPRAQTLAEEGVVIPPDYILHEGKPKWKQIREYFKTGPYPSRSIEENIADLRAAVAANHRGKSLLQTLINRQGFDTVQHYMDAIRQRATDKIHSTIQKLDNGKYSATEYLDDQTPLHVTINIYDDEISFNFEGTGAQHAGNLNATPAIVYSVVTYILRLLVNEPLPLNEGLLEPVTINIPASLLNPDFQQDNRSSPAVVGGNTETSQRLVDTLLRPFQLAACSQGTMNNILFGNENFGYYETIGGGTGAGPHFDGADAVHQHMTNTRATDPEILEFRYPVRLLENAIRTDSGGEGKYRGGNGIRRKYHFLESVELSVLTQHRNTVPYGLQGGNPGASGEQYVIRKNGKKKQLDSIDGVTIEEGDQLIVKTPGGGGYGNVE